MTKCCYSYNSMCSCTLGCMPVCWTLFHSHERLVGLCLQLVFRSTCRALTQACPNTGTPCFRIFGPETRTWPVFAQGGGGGDTGQFSGATALLANGGCFQFFSRSSFVAICWRLALFVLRRFDPVCLIIAFGSSWRYYFRFWHLFIALVHILVPASCIFNKVDHSLPRCFTSQIRISKKKSLPCLSWRT